jgi:iron complex outermembrane receptor protein
VRRQLQCSAAIIVAASFVSPLAAQEASAPAPLTAESEAEDAVPSGEIIVTAQRREQRLSEVPLSITALSSADLTRSGVVAAGDLATVTPGLQYPVNGAFAQPTIRGIGTTVTSAGADANVALYVDGVYMPSQAGNIFNFNNIERIEVLKGPQGTLYGRNATGGAINITTLAPSFTPLAKLSASYGSYDEVRLNGYASAPLSSKLAFGIAALYVDDNGYTRDRIRDVRLSTYDERALRGKLLYRPTDNLDITLAGDWSKKRDLTGYSLKPLGGNTAQNVVIEPRTHDVALSITPDFSTQSYGGSVTGKLDLGAVALSSITALRKVEAHFLTDLDRTQANASVAEFDTRQRTFTQEFNIASAARGTFTWVAGLFYYDDKANNDNLRTNGVLQSNGQVKSRAYAAYAEGTLNLGPQFSIIAGLRYSSEKRIFDIVRPTGTVLTLHADQKWNSATPRVSLRYEITPEANIYATYSQGFKSGTYNVSAFSAVPVNPEKVRAYEGGFKYYSRGLSFNAAGFYYNYDDIQIQALAPSTGLTALTNAAKAEIYGAEAELTAPLGSGFEVRAGAAWTHGTYTEFPGALITTPRTTGCGVNPNRPCGNVQAPGDASGNAMVRTPRWTANVSPSYRGDIAGGRLDASATLSYNSGFYWDVGNRLRQSAYTLLNGRISWGPDGSPWRVALWGRNLTNRVYEAYVADTTQADAVAWARPRSVGVELSIDLR